MNRSLAAIAATSLFALSAAARAGDNLAVSVHEISIDRCAPPASAKVCDAWHQEIRRNFSGREIGMLFGARTAYPEYRTSFSSVERRYNQLLNSFAAVNRVSVQALAGR